MNPILKATYQSWQAGIQLLVSERWQHNSAWHSQNTDQTTSRCVAPDILGLAFPNTIQWRHDMVTASALLSFAVGFGAAGCECERSGGTLIGVC